MRIDSLIVLSPLQSSPNITTMTFTILPELQDLLPQLPQHLFNELVESIREHGQLIQLLVGVLPDGQQVLVDGHNRYKACQELNVEPTIKYKEFESLVAIKLSMVSINEYRRGKLTQSERNTLIRNIYNELKHTHGGDRGNQHNSGKVSNETLPNTAQTVADKFGVSKATVNRVVKRGKNEDYIKSFNVLPDGWLENMSDEAVNERAKTYRNITQAKSVEEVVGAVVTANPEHISRRERRQLISGLTFTEFVDDINAQCDELVKAHYKSDVVLDLEHTAKTYDVCISQLTLQSDIDFLTNIKAQIEQFKDELEYRQNSAKREVDQLKQSVQEQWSDYFNSK